MRAVQIQVDRGSSFLRSNHERVITRYLDLECSKRIRGVIDRVLAFSEEETQDMLARVMTHFSRRHLGLKSVFLRNYELIVPHLPPGIVPSGQQKLLLGTHFTMEYSIESAALFNPSIILHPDQTGTPAGGKRLLMSLRATGEGHISSIVFRQGVLFADGSISFEEPGQYPCTGTVTPDYPHDKTMIWRKLTEMGCTNHGVDRIMDRLGDRFTFEELDRVIDEHLELTQQSEAMSEAAGHVRHLAQANYEICFPDSIDAGDMVIYPMADREIQGMEDVRLVRFVDDDGSVTFFGTYTAYDGSNVLPQIFETTDLRRFRVMTLSGRCARNKGMAMFPRKIDGQYMMVSRHDGESLYLMRSDNPHIWNNAELLQRPVSPWESVQIGNCGSPLETDRGWLLLTHGVGPMRQYCIGALLLDLNDPLKVIGRTQEPILVPTEKEREGYVPNVVYTCGGLIQDGKLIMPYAMSDVVTGFATVDLQELLDYMQVQPVTV